jgi:hypothetical protein
MTDDRTRQVVRELAARADLQYGHEEFDTMSDKELLDVARDAETVLDGRQP